MSFVGPLQVRIKIYLIYNEILIKGKIKAEVNFTCSRCLKIYEDSLNINIEVKYEVDEVGKSYLDLDEEFRQSIVLSLPMKPLCRKNCKGLCPQCGRDKNLRECTCKNNSSANRNQWMKIRDLYKK